jgi:hypothetical protein
MSGSSPPLLLIPGSGFVAFIHSRKELACAGVLRIDASFMQCERAVVESKEALSKRHEKSWYRRVQDQEYGGRSTR